MNGDIKRKIDHLRDLLVGKIPVPTDQVKQITLGLIYKFMSDIDEHNRELGGISFFSADYQHYAWKHILDHSLSAYERVVLYSEGLEKMSLNPNIPQLFRDIFKGAFLPFKDPATVDQFLKGLNEFEYQHSEDLGDAYEYLLSIMGSQGDAGQFRTPRHIIDFIVAAVEPHKEDRMLDPACGTAGFLVSAYKYILKENTLPGSDRPGSALQGDERRKITENFVGYDISQDMMRISLVNMYLHQFTDPQIYEYDTLTSLERWNDTFDCILTNPPFMSPSGGIRPHNRFGVHSSRSEVLFVDYLMEHLSPGGKAGVIVPEGIIFQSQNAYKQLRQKLVEENYLYAVVSLPAGVFQPYSGVKTSILLIDRRLAQKVKDILFVKVESDGFDPGATKRPIEKNDLPEALGTIKDYKISLITGKDSQIDESNRLSVSIAKEKIAKNGDYNFSADLYKKSQININQKWPLIKLNEICDFIDDGDWIENKDQSKAGIRLIQTGNIGCGIYIDKPDKAKFISEETFNKLKCEEVYTGDLLISRLPDPVGRSCLVPDLGSKKITAVDCTIIRVKENIYSKEFLLYITNSENYFLNISKYLTGASRQRISRTNLSRIEIPIPPIDIQREIVSDIEEELRKVDACKKLIETYEAKIKEKICEVWGE